MKTYVNLHTHGVYSMLDGHGTYERYAKRVDTLGMPALGITEHGNIHGWLEFYDACKEIGIKPILGSEFYQARKSRFDRDEEERSGPASSEWEQRGPYHLTVLAQNEAGYRNGIHLSSKAYTEGYYVKPRIDFDLLSQHSEGIIILSGCLSGGVQQAIRRGDMKAAVEFAATMQDIVGKDNYYIEIMNHDIPEEMGVMAGLLEVASKIGAKLVPTGDCHYVHKEDADSHDLMLCAGTGARVHQENRFKFSGPEFYLKEYDEMAKLFPDDWLKNTLEIADKVDVKIEFEDFHFPAPPLSVSDTLEGEFDIKVWEGLKARYGDPLPDDILARAEHEIGVVKRMGFPGYFLVVAEIVNWAKDNGIRVGFGRGSAAGCIISYALKITNLDPVKYGLMFERFLVEGRKSMPDIDLDFDDRYRDLIIQHIKDTYGEDRVCQIATFTSVGAKSAIRDAARVLDFEYQVGDKLSKMVPPPILGVSKSLKECMETADIKHAYNTDADSKKILDAAMGLEGVVRQSGIHAAGVIITPDNITNFIPVMKKGEGTPLVSQWDMVGAERAKLLKMDILGLRNLGVIDICVDYALSLARNMGLDIDEIPLDDEATFAELCQGHAIGVFQLESAGLRQMAIELRPDCIDDIAALVALYRPGPLGSGMHKMYINRKNQRESVTYPHPKLADVLDNTYGIMLYQEDVLNVVKHMAGFSIPEADDLRKVMGKKLMDKVSLYREKFVKGCREHSDVDERLANKIYSDIEYFAGYGFNKAHAYSYAMICYLTMYLKTHYPAEYMAALMSTVTKDKDKLVTYLNECRRMGVSVLPPSINQSMADFTVLSDTEIRFGLNGINGIGGAAADKILESRDSTSPYYSIHDFFRRVNPDILNKATFEHLARSGALDDLLSDHVESLLDRNSSMEVLSQERHELGVYLTEHPLEGLEYTLSSVADKSILDLELCSDGEYVKVAGIITKVVPKTTKRGDQMFYLFLEDLTSMVEVVVFPAMAKEWASKFEEGDIVIISARVSKEGTDEENAVVKLFFHSLEVPELPDSLYGKPVILAAGEMVSYDTMERLMKVIENNPGSSPVFLEVDQDRLKISLAFEKTVDPSIEDVLEKLLKLGEMNESV